MLLLNDLKADSKVDLSNLKKKKDIKPDFMEINAKMDNITGCLRELKLENESLRAENQRIRTEL